MAPPLADRIAAARQDLAAVDARRREANTTLDRILSAVEARFAARTAERDHVRARLGPLTEANRMLVELAERLAGQAERAAEADRAVTGRLAAALDGTVPVAADWRFEDVSAKELDDEERAASY